MRSMKSQYSPMPLHRSHDSVELIKGSLHHMMTSKRFITYPLRMRPCHPWRRTMQTERDILLCAWVHRCMGARVHGYICTYVHSCKPIRCPAFLVAERHCSRSEVLRGKTASALMICCGPRPYLEVRVRVKVRVRLKVSTLMSC